MEDIQDGVKTSIQDGVKEDPSIPKYTGTKLASLGYDYGIKPTEIKIETELATTTDSEDFVGTISAILGTSVV